MKKDTLNNTKNIDDEEVRSVEDIDSHDIEGQKEISHDDCEKRFASAEEKAKRYLADYQNLERRMQEQRVEWIRSANKDLLLKLLPVLDTLMLASIHIKDKGLELGVNEFLHVLEKEGVEKIKTVGVEFDPRTMEAITTQKVEGKVGKVIEELKAGYQIYDTILRAAQVVVGE